MKREITGNILYYLLDKWITPVLRNSIVFSGIFK